jgi:hypothetical protein
MHAFSVMSISCDALRETDVLYLSRQRLHNGWHAVMHPRLVRFYRCLRPQSPSPSVSLVPRHGVRPRHTSIAPLTWHSPSPDATSSRAPRDRSDVLINSARTLQTQPTDGWADDARRPLLVCCVGAPPRGARLPRWLEIRSERSGKEEDEENGRRRRRRFL